MHSKRAVFSIEKSTLTVKVVEENLSEYFPMILARNPI